MVSKWYFSLFRPLKKCEKKNQEKTEKSEIKTMKKEMLLPLRNVAKNKRNLFCFELFGVPGLISCTYILIFTVSGVSKKFYEIFVPETLPKTSKWSFNQKLKNHCDGAKQYANI